MQVSVEPLGRFWEAEEYHQNFYRKHPEAFAREMELSGRKKVVAIGEIGLDYYWTKDNKDKQIEYFKEQLKLAKKYDLPVIVHARDSIQDVYDILKESGIKKGSMHCYSGSLGMAKEFIKLGFKIGIDGPITFKNNKKGIEIVKNIDLEDILLETDSPYLSPEPNRGKQNLPLNLIYIAKKIAASLASTGTPSFFVHPAEASHGDLGMITNDDVIIAISNSGESKELSDILNYAKRFGIKLIAITKNPESSLGKLGDVVLKLPSAKEAGPLGLAPTSSTTATLVLGDILTVAMIERSSFSKEQFNQRHPGGKLGSVLQKVSDLMHKGENMPILPLNSGMHETLLEMTSKRLGCVGFVDDNGNLVGMLTDGDLRRCLSPDILSKKAYDVMTKNPKVISPDAMASEAVKLMNEKKITNVFAVIDGKPVGVIHIHDCLDNGVV